MPGYQLQAAIAACHCEALTWDDTDWQQILVLYDMLLLLQPTPVTKLHRAIAARYVNGVQAALEELDDLHTALKNYPLFHATRAEFLRADGSTAEAHDADQQALKLTSNPAQLDILHDRLAAY
jgi:predicted RNA polymerase sigma factor